MLLLIDAGNTRVKWGIAADAMLASLTTESVSWRHYGVLDRTDLDQLERVWKDLPVTRVVVANVAGAALRERLQAILQSVFGASIEIVWFASQALLAGVRSHYRNPVQLGCDRFAAVIGARALFPQRALIVATCGTATTVDAVTRAGEFIGGMILPGLGVMATSLALNTAQLPQIQHISTLTTPFADNTDDAIVAGCIAAQAGAIERAVQVHRAQQGDVICVLAGGAGKVLAPYLAVPCENVDNLVLIGLQVAASV
jgi:type III pantothenate kinase